MAGPLVPETRYQRIAREQRERREAREAKLKAEQAAARKAKRKGKRGVDAYTPPSCDPDGLWRDNLGESPDY